MRVFRFLLVTCERLLHVGASASGVVLAAFALVERSAFSSLGLAVVLGCLGVQAAWWIGWSWWHPALRVMCTLLLMIPVVALVPASNPCLLTALCVWQGFVLLSLIAVMVREVLTQEVDLRRSAAHPAGMAGGERA